MTRLMAKLGVNQTTPEKTVETYSTPEVEKVSYSNTYSLQSYTHANEEVSEEVETEE